MNDCKDCGEPTPNEYNICAGAAGYERMNSDVAITDYKGLMTCNCCDSCRIRCFESMQEEYPNEL